MNGPDPTGRKLAGQTVLVLGGTAGIGLATARRAREEGAKLILDGPRPRPAAPSRPRPQGQHRSVRPQ